MRKLFEILRPNGIRMTAHVTINRYAQSTIEFTFAVVVVALLIYGLLRIFRWSGMDYADRSYQQFQSSFEEPNRRNLGGRAFVGFEEGQLNAVAGQRTQRIGAFTRRY